MADIVQNLTQSQISKRWELLECLECESPRGNKKYKSWDHIASLISTVCQGNAVGVYGKDTQIFLRVPFTLIFHLSNKCVWGRMKKKILSVKQGPWMPHSLKNLAQILAQIILFVWSDNLNRPDAFLCRLIFWREKYYLFAGIKWGRKCRDYCMRVFWWLYLFLNELINCFAVVFTRDLSWYKQ